jgi:hypothetical protein
MINNSDVAVVPLINGIPDIASRLVVDTGTDITSGRDISFDAAGNIHYVSSGQALYRVIAPGGTSWTKTAWNGSGYSFSVNNGSWLQISQTAGQVKIEWPFGILQESPSMTGPWSDSASQVSPYTFAPIGDMKFFRLRGS